MTTRDDSFLIIKGAEHCKEINCNQLDFLPLKCQSCKLPFCSSHFRELQHDCKSYDPLIADNRIPQCPLCSLPISYPPSTDPNLAMNTHLESSCPILNPPSSSSSSKQIKKLKLPDGIMLKCDKKGCLVKMVVPMKCEGCDDLFCAIHRFSKDHFCNSSKLKLKGKENISNTKKNWSTIELEKIKNPISLPSIKPKSQNPPPPPLSPPSSSPQTTLKATIQKPLTQLKISKQALSERKSQKKGLEIRAKKGLLNEREILEYATLCALESKGGREGGEGKGCLIC